MTGDAEHYLSAINNLTVLLAATRDTDEFFKAAVEYVRDMTGARLVAGGVYVPERVSIRFCHGAGEHGSDFSGLTALLARSADGIMLPVTEEYRKLVMKGRVARLGGVEDLLMRSAPPHVVDKVREILGDVQMYGLAFQDGERLLGTMAVVMPAASQQPTFALLETLANVVAAGLKRCEAEAARAENEEGFQAFIKKSAYGYVETDLVGTIKYVNPQIERLSGYTAGEAIGMNLMEVIPPEERDRAARDLEEALMKPNDGVREYTLVRKDGERRTIEVNALPLRKAGVPCGFQLTVFDVSDRKRALEEACNAARRIAEQNKFNRIRAEIWKLASDKSLSEQDFILRMLEMTGPAFGVSRASFNQKRGDWVECIMEWRAEGVASSVGERLPVEIVMAFIRQGLVTLDRRLAMELLPEETRSGLASLLENFEKQLDLDCVVMAPYYVNGDFEGVISLDVCRSQRDKPEFTENVKDVIREMVEIVSRVIAQRRAEKALEAARNDLERRVNERTLELTAAKERLEAEIAERKHTEEALRASERLYHTLVEASPDGIVLTGPDMRIVMANQRVAEMYGSSVQELIGRSAMEFIAPEDRERAAKHLMEILAKGSVANIEYRVLRKDGTAYPAEINAVALKNEAGEVTGFLGVIRNIEARKKVEDALIRAGRLESIGILAGGIAHDFNNVLTAIVGHLSLVRTAAGKAETLDAVAAAEEAAAQARRLTQQLLAFSRGGAPVKEMASVQELLREGSEFVLRGSNISGLFQLPEDLWAVEVDKAQINQVIANLVINARQAMPDGGVVRVSAENVILKSGDVPDLPAGRYVKMSIQDSGVGIPRENFTKIFDPYFTTKPGGTGLGLTIVYHTVSRHGGQVVVESEVGKGSSFHVYLPASFGKSPARPLQRRKLHFGKGHILVMDDEEVVRKALEAMLSYLGYTPVFAADGKEAVAIYREAMEQGRRFLAVIMDVTVPGGMGGKEAARLLLDMDPDVRAIVSSGYSDDPVMAEYRSHGFKAVIAKPYKLEDLSEVLHAVLS